jgi:hypothetical protein
MSHRALTEELLLINFEERAGVQRIAAWQSFATRAGFESARSFVAMLIQTDRFGTPIAKSLGCLLLHRLLGYPICRPEATKSPRFNCPDSRDSTWNGNAAPSTYLQMQLEVT